LVIDLSIARLQNSFIFDIIDFFSISFRKSRKLSSTSKIVLELLIEERIFSIASVFTKPVGLLGLQKKTKLLEFSLTFSIIKSGSICNFFDNGT
jgi:hypothetical protein